MSEEKEPGHTDHVERSKKLLEKAEKLKDDGDASKKKNSSGEKIAEIKKYMTKMKEKIEELEDEVISKTD